MKFLLLGAAVLLGLACSTFGQAEQPYSSLRQALLQNYDAGARPGTPAKPITVELGMNLNTMSIDEWSSALHTNAFIFMSWEDGRLKWDPASYSGIDSIRISPASVWLPDITLYNEIPGFSAAAEAMEKLVVIYSNGTVLWVPSLTLKTLCTLDLVKFPRDRQRCVITLGSWTYDSKEIELQLADKPIRQYFFVHNSPWHIAASFAEKHDETFPDIEGIYPTLRFVFYLHRNVTPYCITLYTPILVCILAAVAGLLVSHRGTSYNSELIVTTLITTSILMMVAMYHGVALRVSPCGIPCIMKFIGGLITLEALLLPLKATYSHFMMGLKNMTEKDVTKPVPQFASAIINFNFLRRGKKAQNGSEDQSFLLASEMQKKNTDEWARLGCVMWGLMVATYVFGLALVSWLFLIPI